jgi:hypothetical protein
MPTVEKITALLLKAGFVKSKAVTARAGRKADTIPGFQVTGKVTDRRVVYVYHVAAGTKIKASLAAYTRVLADAGLVVTPHRDGLQVRSKRSLLQRGQE